VVSSYEAPYLDMSFTLLVIRAPIVSKRRCATRRCASSDCIRLFERNHETLKEAVTFEGAARVVASFVLENLKESLRANESGICPAALGVCVCVCVAEGIVARLDSNSDL
jgi:hypothetical protein